MGGGAHTEEAMDTVMVQRIDINLERYPPKKQIFEDADVVQPQCYIVQTCHKECVLLLAIINAIPRGLPQH